MGIGWIGFIEAASFIGSGSGSIDPLFIVTDGGETVTNAGAMVTNTIPIPEGAVYSSGELVANGGAIVTSGA